MKKFNLLLFVILLAFSQKSFSQGPISTLFFENFYDTTNIKMVDTSTSGLNSWGPHWLAVSPPFSDTGRVAYKDTIYLTTPIIDITGKKSVVITFDHVAKVHT